MRDALLAGFDEAFDKRSWHGPNLRSSIRGVSIQLAAWRPGPGRHNIWELILHAAYWKYIVRRRISGEKRGAFPLKGSNFMTRPVEATEAALKADIALLESEHQQLRDLIASLPTPRLNDAKLVWMIRGVASHDLYHAGQIQLLKRLAGDVLN